MYVSFREQIETKIRKKKATEVRSAQYICAGELFSKDRSEGSQEYKNIHTFTYQKTLLHTLFCLFLKSSKAFSVSVRHIA